MFALERYASLSEEMAMKVRKFSRGDVVMERSPGQDGDIFTCNLVDERDGAPITIGYGRWGTGETLEETMAVDDVMIILEGRLSVTSDGATVQASAGEIVHMPKGARVLIECQDQALTAYVTYPHWRTAHG